MAPKLRTGGDAAAFRRCLRAAEIRNVDGVMNSALTTDELLTNNEVLLLELSGT